MRNLLLLSGVTGLCAACSGAAPLDGAESGNGMGLGRLQVGLTSSARRPSGRDALTSAFIRVDNVKAHAAGGGGWVTVRDGIAVDVDVFRLGEHAVDLGFADLPAGKITQIRLHIDGAVPPYVVLPDGSNVPLKVPSGEQSGLKVKGSWDLGECEQLAIDLDLDGPKSIHIHPVGSRDLWILRPVIKAGRDATTPSDDCTPSDPNDPNDPNNPGDPNDPNDPGDDPNDPNDPGDDPNDPNDPGDPTDPNDPGDPNDPNDPGDDPNDPNNPGDPNDPNDPGDPNVPGDPGGEPGTPCEVDIDCNMGSYCNEAGVCVAL